MTNKKKTEERQKNEENKGLLDTKTGVKTNSKIPLRLQSWSQQKASQRGKLKQVKMFKLITDQNVNLIAKLSASLIWKFMIMLEVRAKI